MRRLGPAAFARFLIGAVGAGGRRDVCNLVIVDTSTNYAAAPCEWVRVDASGGARTVMAPSSPEGGQMFAVGKIDASENDVTVHVNAGVQVLPGEGDAVVYRYEGSAWAVVALDTTPQLQELNGAYAAWSLDQANGVTKADRSGNGRNADSYFAGLPLRIASPRPRRRAFAMDGSINTGPVFVEQTEMPVAHFAANGFSAAFWYCWMGITPQPSSPEAWLLTFSSDFASWMPLYYDVGNASDPGGILRTWTNGVAKVSSLRLDPTFGIYQFVQTSWEPNGDLIIGLDDNFETFSGATLVAPPPQYPFGIGGPGFSSTFRRYCTGGFSDVAICDHGMTIAEFRAQRASTGVPLP